MIYLALAIVSSTMVSVCMRLSEKHTKNNTSMLAMNYVMCTLMAGMFAFSGGLLPTGEGSAFTWGLGAVSGALYLASFLLLQWNIRMNGVTLPATFMKLGVLVPTIMAMLVFGEMPSLLQALGIAGAIAAILMIRLEKGVEKAKSAAGLLILLLGGGSTDATSKVFEELGNAAQKNHFLLITFSMALVLCILLALRRGEGLTRADAAFGLLIGVPNYLSSRFLLLSLADVPAVIAYPTYSVATIVLITLLGRALFAERLSRRQFAALGVILVSLALLNL